MKVRDDRFYLVHILGAGEGRENVLERRALGFHAGGEYRRTDA